MLSLCYIMISKGKDIFPKMSKEIKLLDFKVLAVNSDFFLKSITLREKKSREIPVTILIYLSP